MHRIRFKLIIHKAYGFCGIRFRKRFENDNAASIASTPSFVLDHILNFRPIKVRFKYNIKYLKNKLKLYKYAGMNIDF